MLMRWWVLCALGFGAWAQTAPPQFFAIDGTVVRPHTQTPVKHARVTIVRNDRPDQQAFVETGEDGRFHFTDVPPGKYTLSAALHGVNRTFREDGQFSTGIAVGPGLDSQHIVFPLAAPTSLTLELTDDEGETVRNAQVILFRRQVMAGWPQIALVQQQNSDEEGRCRFRGLEAGIYYAAAGGRPWYAQFPMNGQLPESNEASKQLDVAYPTTFYPGTADPNEAGAIAVHEGDDAKVHIALHAVPAVTIDVGSQENQNSHLRIESIGPGGAPFSIPTYEFSGGPQEVKLGGLSPGTYLVTRIHFSPKQNVQGTGSALITLAGNTALSESSFQRGEITGHLSVVDPKQLQGATVALNSVNTGANSWCQVQPDGNFRCSFRGEPGSALTPGRYEIRVFSRSGLYIKSMKAQGASLDNGLLNVTYGSNIQLAITAAPGLTKLDGIALRNGKPYPGAMVLLIPERGDPEIGVPRDQSDSDGTFTLPQVHPGRFHLVAIDHGHDLAYHDPAVIAPYLARATAIEIPAATNAPVAVQVQSRLQP